jgi:hypothetical protein
MCQNRIRRLEFRHFLLQKKLFIADEGNKTADLDIQPINLLVCSEYFEM